MTTTSPSWIARLVAGTELQRAQEELERRQAALLAAENELARTRERLSEVEGELKVRTDIMNLTSIVSEADKRGDILSINDKFIEVSQYSSQELLGRPHNTTRHPDMPRETFKQLWATIGRGEIFRGVIKNRAKDGTPYYVDAVVAPILGANGKPMKYLGVRYDITASEIERQNARGILEAIDTAYAYIEFDLETNILSANDKFLQLMGYQRHEVIGKPHRIFVDPEQAASASYGQFWHELGDGKPRNEVFKRINKAGQTVYLQAAYVPVKDDMGRIVKYIKLATDISAQVETSNMLEQAVEQAQRVTTAARNGDLGQRIPLEGKAGQIRTLCEGVNDLMETTATVFSDIQRVFGHLSGGDLSERITRDYAGSFAQIKDDANATTDKLAGVIGDVDQVMRALAAGDLTQRITREANGVFGQVKLNLNRAIDAVAELVSDADMLAAAAVQGRLLTRAEAGKHQGDFRKIVEGFNGTLDAIVHPLQEIQNVLQLMERGDITAAVAENRP